MISTEPRRLARSLRARSEESTAKDRLFSKRLASLKAAVNALVFLLAADYVKRKIYNDPMRANLSLTLHNRARVTEVSVSVSDSCLRLFNASAFFSKRDLWNQFKFVEARPTPFRRLECWDPVCEKSLKCADVMDGWKKSHAEVIEQNSSLIPSSWRFHLLQRAYLPGMRSADRPNPRRGRGRLLRSAPIGHGFSLVCWV